MGGTCNTYGRDEKGIQHFSRTPDGKRLKGRPRREREDNVGKISGSHGVEYLDYCFLGFRAV
jgi:hypothetical protein